MGVWFELTAMMSRALWQNFCIWWLLSFINSIRYSVTTSDLFQLVGQEICKLGKTIVITATGVVRKYKLHHAASTYVEVVK